MQVTFEEQQITFSAVQYEMDDQGKATKKVAKQFRNEIDLYAKVKVDVILIIYQCYFINTLLIGM